MNTIRKNKPKEASTTSTFVLFFPLIFLYAAIDLSAQKIALYLPEFEDFNWSLSLYQGAEQPFVIKGAIPANGKVLLEIPENYQNYVGLARLALNPNGGAVDMILSGQDFSVECLSGQLLGENIKFIASPENDFVQTYKLKYQRFFFKSQAMDLVKKAYPPGSKMYKKAEKESLKLEKDYQNMRKAHLAYTDFVALLLEIERIKLGFGSRLKMNRPELVKELDQFMRRDISWELLYRSHHWEELIALWIQLHLTDIRDDQALVDAIRNGLLRLKDPVLYTSFCDNVARTLLLKGKDNILAAISTEVKNSGKLAHSEGALAQYGAPQAGELAPNLDFVVQSGDTAEHKQQTLVLRPTALSEAYSLLVFYQSGCGPCENLLPQLVGNYPQLEERGVRLISISADTDHQIFEDTAKSHPWPDKYCDEKGMSGPNFERYGVVGTPTMFLLDKVGRILLRTADLTEVLAYFDTKK